LAGVLTLSACGNKTDNNASKLKIVTTIFPEYDWVRVILGNNIAQAELTMLLNNGIDLHSYQPTFDDILKIANCDIFIYVGGESDKWVDDALKQANGEDMTVINLLETLGDSIKEEEVKEGMQAEDEKDAEEEDEGPEYDEHVWLSLKNAKILVKAIADAVAKADAENSQTYIENAEKYISRLDELDEQYQQGIEFRLADDMSYPEDYPKEGKTITVIGTFSTYMEGADKYIELADSSIS